MRARKIKPRIHTCGIHKLYVTGWLAGKDTYLWFGDGSDETGGRLLGVLHGQSLARLAQAIARHTTKGK